MIAQIGSRLKVEKSSQPLTSFAGLPLLTELAHQIGLIKKLDAIPGFWKRDGVLTTSDYVMGLALTLAAGGEGLDDIRLLAKDPGLKRLVFPHLPAANSVGRFLKRFGHRTLLRLGEAAISPALLALKPGKTYTLDMDATLIESQKEDAKKTYKGFEGYDPVLAWIAEENVFVGGVFRDGNASPQSNLVSLLRWSWRRLPKGIKLRLRSDSAGYRLDLLKFCHDKKIEVAIGADLDAAVVKVIETIPDNAWKLVVRGKDVFLLAETIHAPGGANSSQPLPSYRLIVTRRTGQLDLFKPAIKYRAILTDLPDSYSTEEALDYYNARGTAEKAIGELKHGFGLDRLPCGELFANAAFFQICLLAYNLVQTFKRCALPESWRTLCIKNLRFRLLGQAAVVVRHARNLTIKLSRDFPFYEVFQRARWLVLSPPLANAAT